MHLTGHNRPACRVFETPALDPYFLEGMTSLMYNIQQTKLKVVLYLSMEMQTTMLLERKRPKILTKEQSRHIKSPAHHDTVMAHAISNGIIKNVT
jgi:hypothetical protein